MSVRLGRPKPSVPDAEVRMHFSHFLPHGISVVDLSTGTLYLDPFHTLKSYFLKNVGTTYGSFLKNYSFYNKNLVILTIFSCVDLDPNSECGSGSVKLLKRNGSNLNPDPQHS